MDREALRWRGPDNAKVRSSVFRPSSSAMLRAVRSIESLYGANAKYEPEWVPPLHLLRILSRPTENRDRGTQGRGLR